MKQDWFVSFFFIAVLIFIIYLICRIFSPFLTAMFWSAILVFALYPTYTFVLNKFKSYSTLVAIAMTFLTFLLVILPLVLISVTVIIQAIESSQWAYDYIRQGNLEQLIETIRAAPWVQKVQTQIVQWDIVQKNLSSWLLSISKNIGNATASQLGAITKNILFFLLNLIFIFFLTFVFFKHGQKIYDFIYEIAPFEKKTKEALFVQINETLAAVIRGQLFTSFAQALLAGFAFWLLGIPVPVFFAFLLFMTSMIPVLGAISVWLPLVFYLVFLKFYLKALILFLIGSLVISLIDNLIKPAIIGKKTKLNYFVLFFGIMGGLKFFGLMGIFLAPVVLSLFFALIKIYREKYV